MRTQKHGLGASGSPEVLSLTSMGTLGSLLRTYIEQLQLLYMADHSPSIAKHLHIPGRYFVFVFSRSHAKGRKGSIKGRFQHM